MIHISKKMSKENTQIFKKFKSLTKYGFYAPLEVLADERQGFLVKATAFIEKLSLLCEYAGEVDFERNHKWDDNDSIMQLLETPNSDQKLCILPDRYANIARFISGINNHDKKGKRKQNVKNI